MGKVVALSDDTPEALTPRSATDPNSWVDDPAIRPSDTVVRLLLTGYHITSDGAGGYKVSSQAFAASGGISVELERLYEGAGTNIERRCQARAAIGAVRLSAAAIRATAVKYNQDQTPSGTARLGICYTPDQAEGTNAFHCDIFPAASKPNAASKILHSAAAVAVPIDQAKAAALKAQIKGEKA